MINYQLDVGFTSDDVIHQNLQSSNKFVLKNELGAVR